VLVAAAVYEFIPLKNVCLMRCRGQLGYSRGASADRWSGPLWTGIRSGGWCIGCSGALMAALFALGVMSLTWMVLLAG
jgi:predicted metal-binding membrane protein